MFLKSFISFSIPVVSAILAFFNEESIIEVTPLTTLPALPIKLETSNPDFGVLKLEGARLLLVGVNPASFACSGVSLFISTKLLT